MKDVFVNLEELEINRRNAVLPREDRGDHIVRDQPQLDKIEPQSPAVFALIIKRFAKMLRTNEILPNENFA